MHRMWKPLTAPNSANNIKVVVRVRPANEKEKELKEGRKTCVFVDEVDDRVLVFDPKEEERPCLNQGVQVPNKRLLKGVNKHQMFLFDHVCHTNSTNVTVFEKSTKNMISSLMEGFNCSVFMYGATGSGKTYTMIGNRENPGLTYLTMTQLFNTIHEQDERDCKIAVSYIEVYNENVYDLLKPSHTPLQLREDKNGVIIAGITLNNNIKTAQKLLNMLEEGNKNRTQHPTDANTESSRSHAVLQVYLNMRYKMTGELCNVKLSMIDLAGSERNLANIRTDRFKEGTNINKSLLALGNCINRLADGSQYIPYRDSKLTRILKDSLGGNCKTVLIANISPSSTSYGDTYNTLKFAARASKVRLTIKKNMTVDPNKTLSHYVKINKELIQKIKMLEAQPSTSEPVNVKEKDKQECRCRILKAEEGLRNAESALIALMIDARAVALRRYLHTRTALVFPEFVHRSCTDDMELSCTEDNPRNEREEEEAEEEACQRQEDKVVQRAWHEREQARAHLTGLLDRALTDHPDLGDFALTVQQRSDINQLRAEDELRYKLLTIEKTKIYTMSEHLNVMQRMAEKLYLTLKEKDEDPPSFAEEYLKLMKNSKTMGISWSYKDSDWDTVFKAISSMDLLKSTNLIDTKVCSTKKRKNKEIEHNADRETTGLTIAKKIKKCDKEPTAIDPKGSNSLPL